MSAGERALRRTDVAACTAMGAAVLFAQASMWSANDRAIYPVAAVLSTIVGLIVAWQLACVAGGTARAAVRVGVPCLKIAACVGLLLVLLETNSLTAMSHSAPHPSTIVAFGAVLLLVQLVQSASVATRRDLALGAPIVCAMLTQAGLAAHDASLAIPFVASLAAMVVAVALVYRGELLDEATHLADRSVAGASLAPLARVAAVAGVVLVLAPNSMHLGAAPATHASPGKRSYSTSSNTSGDVNGSLSPHSQALADPSAGTLDLRVRGALSQNPVFVTDASSPAYWRGLVYDHYDGTTWTMTGSGSAVTPWTATGATSGVAVWNAPADPYQPAGSRTTTRTDSVQIVTAQPEGVIFAPGHATSYLGPGQVAADAEGNPRLDVASTGAPSSRDYDVTSTIPIVADAAVATAGAAVGPAVGSGVGSDPASDPRWRQLPAEMPARVKALGVQLAGHAKSPADAVVAIDDYLHRNEVYDLSAPVPAAGEDAVDDFLFHSHRGFCEQFATAAVVLLRSAGIPSRLVTGYSQGDISTTPGKRIMRGSDAHAWIQVWYPGVGWVMADPTANAVLGQPVLSQPAGPAGPAREPVNRAVARIPGGRLGLAAGIGLLASLALAFRSLFVRARRKASQPRLGTDGSRLRGPAGGPVLQSYLRLDLALAARGYPAMPGETARDLDRRLATPPPTPGSLEQAVDLLERECYGIEPLSPVEVASAVGLFDALCRTTQGIDEKAFN
jgi:protein-glutamine gamma-glutamyltransferase